LLNFISWTKIKINLQQESIENISIFNGLYKSININNLEIDLLKNNFVDISTSKDLSPLENFNHLIHGIINLSALKGLSTLMNLKFLEINHSKMKLVKSMLFIVYHLN